MSTIQDRLTDEIIIYRPDDITSIEVSLSDETVWLTQQQMTLLFLTTKQNVSLHIGNIFREGELHKESVVKECLTTGADGKRYRTKLYNLDVIISVGYRVKSVRGTQFRQWATRVLRDFLLRGYAINDRFERLERRVTQTEEKIDFFVRTSLPPHHGVFYDGQVFEAHAFVSRLVRQAHREIVLIDNYIDETVLTLLDRRGQHVSAMIYTSRISPQLQLDINRHNAQYAPIVVNVFRESHDRFLCIDDVVYHIGASIKDLGKKWFAFSHLNDVTPTELVSRINQ